jgi:hypothetical protein
MSAKPTKNTARNVAAGAVGGAAYDMLLAIPVQYALSNVPQIGFYESFDKTKPMVTRLTLPDCLAVFTGGAMAIFGRKGTREVGYGVVSGVLALKAAEIGHYFATKAGVTYTDQLKASANIQSLQTSPVMFIPRTRSPASLSGNVNKTVHLV